MTDEQWKSVDKTLSVANISRVELLIDGYHVTLALMQYSRWKNAIFVYVNGVMKGKWLTEDCEERRRFFPHKKKCFLRDEDFKKLGIKGKREIENYKKKYTVDTYSGAWTDFRAMKKHLIENNNDITLVRVI